MIETNSNDPVLIGRLLSLSQAPTCPSQDLPFQKQIACADIELGRLQV